MALNLLGTGLLFLNATLWAQFYNQVYLGKLSSAAAYRSSVCVFVASSTFSIALLNGMYDHW